MSNDKPMEQMTLDFAPSEETISGTVRSLVFVSDDERYCVFKLQAAKSRSTQTVTMNAPPPLIGQQVTLTGARVIHPRFGEQFKAVSIVTSAPTDVAGIERFLASGVIDGVGAAMARRLVAEFGDKTLEVIEQTPKMLERVAGIGQKTAQKIAESYRRQSELKDIMLWLETHGISGTYAAKIFKEYDSFATDILKNHPYRLARDIDGIGFTIADTLARSMGLSADSVERIAAGLEHELSGIAQFGHCCVPDEVLVDKTAEFLHVDKNAVWDVCRDMLQSEQLIAEESNGMTLLYPPYLYRAEKNAARRLLDLQKYADELDFDDAAEAVRNWEKNSRLALADKQRQAVEQILRQGIFILTGGPGTGKTTVLKAAIDILQQAHLAILQGAPTGRAAKRLAEATGRSALTLHRMLEAEGNPTGARPIFGRDADNPLDADVIILDEMSMTDIALMDSFLAAVPDGCRLVLVGDANQLPSVGAGSVLADILRSKKFPAVALTEVFRQGEQSTIALNAQAINHGRLPKFNDHDFVLKEFAEQKAVADAIVKLCGHTLPAAGCSPFTDVQVLSPMHRTDCGVSRLNNLLQQALNPPGDNKAEITFGTGGQLFRQGDKVMQTKNNYEKSVFNGDIGFIEQVGDNYAVVRYAEDLVVRYEKNELAGLTLAYAMSVHKSQGSEYPVVILSLVRAHYIMLQRNLLYTAVTRAKKAVIIVGDKAALNTAVMNDRQRKRYTLLAERLNESLA